MDGSREAARRVLEWVGLTVLAVFASALLLLLAVTSGYLIASFVQSPTTTVGRLGELLGTKPTNDRVEGVLMIVTAPGILAYFTWRDVGKAITWLRGQGNGLAPDEAAGLAIAAVGLVVGAYLAATTRI